MSKVIVGDLVRPTAHACQQLERCRKDDLGIVTRIHAGELGRRAIVYVLWNGGNSGRYWEKVPIAMAWLEKVNENR